MFEMTHPRQGTDIETHIMPDGTCLLVDAVSNEGLALIAAGALLWDYGDGTLSAEYSAAELATLVSEEQQSRTKTLSLLEELGKLGYLPADSESSPEPHPETGAAE